MAELNQMEQDAASTGLKVLLFFVFGAFIFLSWVFCKVTGLNTLWVFPAGILFWCWLIDVTFRILGGLGGK